MKLVVVSTFWNAEKFIEDCINSIKNQYSTNYIAYIIDDLSTDNSYEIAKKTIGDDDRFVLVKNNIKKFKLKNFIDVIVNNPDIDWDDVIVEIDGDDKLKDNFVFGLLNKIYENNDVWISGSRWEDKYGRSMSYGKADADNARTTSWNFSHMRTYRVFLFRALNIKDLIFENDYLRAAVDIGMGIPMLEMAGNEHYYFLDEVTYIYNWHDHQSYSKNSSFNDSGLQSRTAKHIYSLPKYEKLNLIYRDVDYTKFKFPIYDKNSSELVNDILFKTNDKPFLPNKEIKISEVKYDLVNQILNNKNVYTPTKKENKIQNKPTNRNDLIEIKKGGLVDTARKMKGLKPKPNNLIPNVFGGKKRI